MFGSVRQRVLRPRVVFSVLLIDLSSSTRAALQDGVLLNRYPFPPQLERAGRPGNEIAYIAHGRLIFPRRWEPEIENRFVL